MRLLADENLDNNLLRGVHRRRPEPYVPAA